MSSPEEQSGVAGQDKVGYRVMSRRELNQHTSRAVEFLEGEPDGVIIITNHNLPEACMTVVSHEEILRVGLENYVKRLPDLRQQ